MKKQSNIKPAGLKKPDPPPAPPKMKGKLYLNKPDGSRVLIGDCVDTLIMQSTETISLNLPLSINLDDIRDQALAVVKAYDREILTENDRQRLDAVVGLLDDILEKAINIKQLRGSNGG